MKNQIKMKNLNNKKIKVNNHKIYQIILHKIVYN